MGHQGNGGSEFQLSCPDTIVFLGILSFFFVSSEEVILPKGENSPDFTEMSGSMPDLLNSKNMSMGGGGGLVLFSKPVKLIKPLLLQFLRASSDRPPQNLFLRFFIYQKLSLQCIKTFDCKQHCEVRSWFLVSGVVGSRPS